jgi:hypothetical protein
MITKVLLQEELQEVKDIQQERLILMEQFGILEFNIQDLEHQKQELKTKLVTLKQKETEIGSKLQEKYGVGTINIEKGEFTQTS